MSRDDAAGATEAKPRLTARACAGRRMHSRMPTTLLAAWAWRVAGSFCSAVPAHQGGETGWGGRMLCAGRRATVRSGVS
jgi:hypothetical protein